jgi:hypothetical protein
MELADRVLDDVVYDVERRVVDAAGFPDFGFLFDLGLMAFGESDDRAEEPLNQVNDRRGCAHGV